MGLSLCQLGCSGPKRGRRATHIHTGTHCKQRLAHC